jgi:hypothetical protein
MKQREKRILGIRGRGKAKDVKQGKTGVTDGAEVKCRTV